jgi:hypothetical protein
MMMSSRRPLEFRSKNVRFRPTHLLLPMSDRMGFRSGASRPICWRLVSWCRSWSVDKIRQTGGSGVLVSGLVVFFAVVPKFANTTDPAKPVKRFGKVFTGFRKIVRNALIVQVFQRWGSVQAGYYRH